MAGNDLIPRCLHGVKAWERCLHCESELPYDYNAELTRLRAENEKLREDLREVRNEWENALQREASERELREERMRENEKLRRAVVWLVENAEVSDNDPDVDQWVCWFGLELHGWEKPDEILDAVLWAMDSDRPE